MLDIVGWDVFRDAGAPGCTGEGARGTVLSRHKRIFEEKSSTVALSFRMAVVHLLHSIPQFPADVQFLTGSLWVWRSQHLPLGRLLKSPQTLVCRTLHVAVGVPRFWENHRLIPSKFGGAMVLS